MGATGERIGQENLVARIEVGKPVQGGRHGCRHRAEVDRDVLGLGDQLSHRVE
jgi:hypothetical protein